MSASEHSATGPAGVLPALDRSHWRIPRFETYPALIDFVRTTAGKVVLVILFAVLMRLHAVGLWTEARGLWLALTATAFVISLADTRRHVVLLGCAALMLAYQPDWFPFGSVFLVLDAEGLGGSVARELLRFGILAAWFALALGAIMLARRYRNHPLGRRPVLVQHVVYLALLALTASHLLHGVLQVLLWGLGTAFTVYFAYLAYALGDQRRPTPAPLVLQLASLNPFTAPTAVPMGKGAANWLSVEARCDHELAVTQLKGLKLLAWALILKGVLWAYRMLVYGVLEVPPLASAFQAFLRTGEVAAPLALLSVLLNFFEQLLNIAIWGHVFVALARLAGFRLLRNTWRPLSARTVAEFWNRYVYYFKELLVQVYFYPTFLTCFKRHPRLRLAFATFMAAGVGNFFLHFILDRSTIARDGLFETLVRMQTYAFYCALLATGIVVSQLRRRQPAVRAGWWRSRFVPGLGVMAFYCLLSFFDGPQGHFGLVQHFAFLFEVFGIDRWIQLS